MVTLFPIALALLAASPETSPEPAVVAVVRVARGHGTISEDGGITTTPASSGRLVRAEATLDTGSGGWMELLVAHMGRVRLSASTRVELAKDGLRLHSGRVWIQTADARGIVSTSLDEHRDVVYSVELPEGLVTVARGSSVIVDHTIRVGSTLVVREGSASLFSARDASSFADVRARELASLAPGAAAVSPVRAGGAGLADLAEIEARAALGDLTGARRFLLEQVARTDPKSAAARGVSELVKSTPEVTGGDPATSALEAAIKAPAFFEDEVPPKGPNVRVRVTFGGN